MSAPPVSLPCCYLSESRARRRHRLPPSDIPRRCRTLHRRLPSATADVVAVLEAAPGSDSPSAWGSWHGMLPGAANCPFKLPPPHVAVACPQLCVADKSPRPRPSPLTPLPPDFWGPVSNFGIPLAAVADTQKSPELYVPRPPSPSPRNQH